jgi:anti-sigma factor RsiW
MSCSPYDLKDYFFGELGAAERGQVEAHLRECPSCREEFERLHVTQAALHTLREEELPRRIAFVSDKVFEPRWWQTLWRSGPRLGFASAAMLAAAILVHAFARPVPPVLPATDTAAIEARVNAEVAKRVDAAIAASEARQQQKTAEWVSAVRQEFAKQQEADRVALASSFEPLQKKYNVLVASAAWDQQR